MSNHENAITPERLAEIKARCEKATQGEWFTWFRGPEHDGDSGCFDVSTHDDDGYRIAMFDQPNAQANRKFCAHARQDIPDLVAHIEEQDAAILHRIETAVRFQSERDEARAEVERLRDQNYRLMSSVSERGCEVERLVARVVSLNGEVHALRASEVQP